LNESFILGGLGYIKVKFLGGFHVLLKGENELKIKEAIEENKEWFEEMFDTIIPWEEQFVAVDKLVWVRCRGDADQDQEEVEAEAEGAHEDISLPQRITRSKFKELGSSGKMFSLFVVSFV